MISNLQPKVFIIILHLKDIPCLIECLSSLDAASYENYEVIVVNNGSGDLSGVQERIKAEIRVIQSPANLGFSRGNNLGIREALKNKADYVLLLNDDTVVSPDFLNVMVDAGENNPDVGMLGPKIYYFDEPRRIWFAGARFDPENCMVTTLGADQLDHGEDAKPFESDYLTGCCLLIKRQAIEKIGLLDERFFLYWEDVDWGLRLKAAGLKLLVVPSAHIWHKASVSTGGPDSSLKAYHKTRSHLLMARLHVPKVLFKLQWRFLRDIAWLLLKSSDVKRFLKARAYLLAIRDYYSSRTGKGPQWLWKD